MIDDARCLASAELPTPNRDLKRCELEAHHKGYHKWSETPEGHERVPLIIMWDEHRCVKVIQGGEE